MAAAHFALTALPVLGTVAHGLSMFHEHETKRTITHDYAMTVLGTNAFFTAVAVGMTAAAHHADIASPLRGWPLGVLTVSAAVVPLITAAAYNVGDSKEKRLDNAAISFFGIGLPNFMVLAAAGMLGPVSKPP